MPPRLLALEYVVEDLEPVLELLVDLLGLEVISRGRHPALDADVVTLDLGTVALTLIHPTAEGDRPALGRPDCNLTQLILESGDPLADVTDRLGEAGVGVVVDGPSMIHLSAQTTAAVFGVAPAWVFTPPLVVDEDPAAVRPGPA